MNDLSRILLYTKKYSTTLLISILAATVFGIVAAMPTYLIKHTVDDIFIKQHRHLIIPFLLLFVLFFALKGFFMYLTSYYMHWVGNKVVNDIRNDLFKKIIHFPTSFFQKNTTGQLMSHFLNDVQMIQAASASAIKNGVRSFFEAIFLISFAFIQNWKLALLMMVVGPSMGIIIKKMGVIIKKASLAIQSEIGGVSSTLQEIFVGIREIKAFNAENIEIKRVESQLDKCFKSIMYHIHFESLLPSTIESIAMVGGGVAFYFATNQVLNGSITPGQMTSFIAAALLAYQPLKKIVSVYSEVQYGLAAASRIFSLMDKIFPATHKQTIKINEFNKNIIFKNVSFSYHPDQPVLNNFSLTIAKGDCIGISGPSGSGKSSFCDLLLGFIQPTTGSILIDGIDITTATSQSLRQQIGYVGQQAFLFNDTVKNNVAYSESKSNYESIVKACKDAHADEFIQKLQNRYETLVGENGSLLSGGQKQRITIARALLKNPQIFVFDEATSSLDRESERMVQLAIRELTGKKTLIIVSHRPSLLKYVDKIIQIKDGRVAEISRDIEKIIDY
jgi:ATP-binding cassette, subfamily B, bacterial MsbA